MLLALGGRIELAQKGYLSMVHPVFLRAINSRPKANPPSGTADRRIIRHSDGEIIRQPSSETHLIPVLAQALRVRRDSRRSVTGPSPWCMGS